MPPAKYRLRVCYALKTVYRSLAAEITSMSAGMRGGISEAALEEVLAASGVKITSEDAEAVARSLLRIQAAAATLLQSLSFDETVERFYRLLDTGTAGGAGA
jgi:hypothetical protein